MKLTDFESVHVTVTCGGSMHSHQQGDSKSGKSGKSRKLDETDSGKIQANKRIFPILIQPKYCTIPKWRKSVATFFILFQGTLCDVQSLKHSFAYLDSFHDLVETQSIIDKSQENTMSPPECQTYPRSNTAAPRVTYTATIIPFMHSFSQNHATSVPISRIHVSVTDLYIPRIGPHIFLQQNWQIDRGNI